MRRVPRDPRLPSLARLAPLLPLGCLTIGCDGQPAPAGLDEPVRVAGAQFIAGALPPATGGPPVTQATTQNAVILGGQGAKLFAGRAGAAASSIAVRFPDLGSGYWVFPLGGPDPQFPGELGWSATCDFSPASLPGPRSLAFAALDGAFRAGPVTTLAMCFASVVPDNLHACDPARPPPDVVFRLSWDSDVDLDLLVVAADGRELGAKRSPGAAAARATSSAYADRDSLAACAPDGLRAEHVVFPTRPAGRYVVYASLFDACGSPTARFTLDAYEAEGTGAGRHLVKKDTRSGRMTELDASGGRDRGLFVLERAF
jgi:hypothetical protein